MRLDDVLLSDDVLDDVLMMLDVVLDDGGCCVWMTDDSFG